MKAFPVVSRYNTSGLHHIDLSAGVLGPFDNQAQMEASLAATLVQYRSNIGSDKILFGGYMERRALYQASKHFSLGKIRNIHLGIDIWSDPGTAIYASYNGIIHSWKYNENHLDYGYCLIIKYEHIYALYGHLSAPDDLDWTPGRPVKEGEIIANIGDKEVNGGWIPHLHLQMIREIGDYKGDYPGVCSEEELEYFSQNCPNPIVLLGLGHGGEY